MPNSASVSSCTPAMPFSEVRSSRSAADAGSARAKGGGLCEESRRFPRAAGEGGGRGELEDEVGSRTPVRGDWPRDAAPLMRFRAAGAAACAIVSRCSAEVHGRRRTSWRRSREVSGSLEESKGGRTVACARSVRRGS